MHLRNASAGLVFLPIVEVVQVRKRTCVMYKASHVSSSRLLPILCRGAHQLALIVPHRDTHLEILSSMSSFSGTPNATNSKRASKMNSQAVNLNHLLNFTLPPRQAQPLANLPRRSRRTGTQQVWNKERTCLDLRSMNWYSSSYDRVHQCSVPLCYESYGRLYCAFCGS